MLTDEEFGVDAWVLLHKLLNNINRLIRVALNAEKKLILKREETKLFKTFS